MVFLRLFSLAKQISYYIMYRMMDDFNSIKAVFFDIDGTLVSFKTHKVAQSTIDAVRKLRGKGVKVFIATGRPRPFIDNLGELEYDGIISANGASCRMEDGTVVHSVPVDKSDLKRLMDYCKDNPIPIAFAAEIGYGSPSPKL